MINKREQRIILLLLIILTLILSFPVIFSLLISFGDNQDITNGDYIPSDFSLENYSRVFERMPLLKYILNSFINSGITTISQIFIGILAAYFFVFIDFKGKNFLFVMFMMVMMIPSEVLIVRNFKTIRDLGLMNSFAGLALPNLASTFGIFLLRQNMLQIPHELKEAASISGVGDFYFLRKVVLPMSKNAIFTLGIYSFLTSWNAYLWPLVSTTDDTVKTAQLGLRDLNSADVLTDFSMIAAGSIIVAIPTLLIIFFGQSKLEEGLNRGSIK